MRNSTNPTNGMTILGRRGGTLFVRLPEELQSLCGICSCSYCKAHPDKPPMWDTLAIGIEKPVSGPDTTYTVHMPDPKDATRAQFDLPVLE